MAEPGLPKDLFEFMQKMWNPMSFPIPGMLTPTANIDEIQRVRLILAFESQEQVVLLITHGQFFAKTIGGALEIN